MYHDILRHPPSQCRFRSSSDWIQLLRPSMPYLDRNYLSVWGGGGGGSDATTTANAATIVVVGGGGYVGSSSSSSSSSPLSWSIVRDPEFYDDYGANGNRNGNVIPSSWFSSGWNVTGRRRRHSGTGSVGRGGDGDGGGKSATNVRKRPLGIEEKEEEGGDGEEDGGGCRGRCRRYR